MAHSEERCLLARFRSVNDGEHDQRSRNRSSPARPASAAYLAASKGAAAETHSVDFARYDAMMARSHAQLTETILLPDG